MSVIHLYPDNGEIACTTKEAFVGKEVRLKELPPLSRLFSDEVEGVVFRLPAVLKSRKIKPILFALASLVCGKYYRQLPAFFYSLPRGSLKTATVA